MTIESAVEAPAVEFLELVEIAWPSETVYMLRGPGGCFAMGQDWLGLSETWGQVMALSARTQKPGEIANRDLTILLTASVWGQLTYGALRWHRVRIWEAARDPATGAIDLAADPWVGFIDMVQGTLRRNYPVTLTLVSSAAMLREPDAPAIVSSNGRARFVSGDTAFNRISAPVREAFQATSVDPSGGFVGGGGFGNVGGNWQLR